MLLPQVCIALPRKLQVTPGMPPAPWEEQPCTGMGLLPVNTPSTSFPTIPVAWLMTACHPAGRGGGEAESPTPAGLSLFPSSCSKSRLSISTTCLGSSQRHLRLWGRAGLLGSRWQSLDQKGSNLMTHRAGLAPEESEASYCPGVLVTAAPIPACGCCNYLRA